MAKQKTQVKPETNTWEVKDRTYFLLHDESPLTYRLASRHSTRHPLLWFDEAQSMQRELRYATNQASPFVDEQKGEVTMGHIVFEDGVLNVPKEKQTLQKLLSIYHPSNGTVYAEFDAVQEAKDDLIDIEMEIEALNMAQAIDLDHAEAILRVEQGSAVSDMTSKEIKRDVLVFAKKNPKLFIDLVNDENVEVRNFGIKAVEANILKLSDDQRTFNWVSNGRKVMTVPFDEHPYSALAAFFKTDEGLEIYKSIEKRLK